MCLNDCIKVIYNCFTKRCFPAGTSFGESSPGIYTEAREPAGNDNAATADAAAVSMKSTVHSYEWPFLLKFFFLLLFFSYIFAPMIISLFAILFNEKSWNGKG